MGIPKMYIQCLIMEKLYYGILNVDSIGNIWRYNKNLKTYRHCESQNENKHLFVTLKHKWKIYRIGSHRIVWIHHNGIIPNHLEINHKNGMKSDNRIENLELLTPIEKKIYRREVLFKPYELGQPKENECVPITPVFYKDYQVRTVLP